MYICGVIWILLEIFSIAYLCLVYCWRRSLVLKCWLEKLTLPRPGYNSLEALMNQLNYYQLQCVYPNQICLDIPIRYNHHRKMGFCIVCSGAIRKLRLRLNYFKVHKDPQCAIELYLGHLITIERNWHSYAASDTAFVASSIYSYIIRINYLRWRYLLQDQDGWRIYSLTRIPIPSLGFLHGSWYDPCPFFNYNGCVCKWSRQYLESLLFSDR